MTGSLPPIEIFLLHFFKEANKDPNWFRAINDGLQALEENNTRTLTTLSPSKKPVGSKWVYNVKPKSNGYLG